MKKLLFTLLVTLIATSASAQKIDTLDDLMTHFSKAEGIDYTVLDSTINLNNFVPDMHSSISLLQILDLSKCEQKDKEHFMKTYEKAFEGYTTMVKSNNDDGTFEQVFIKENENEEIGEFVVFDSSDPVIVRIIGDFKKEDLGNMLENVKN